MVSCYIVPAFSIAEVLLLNLPFIKAVGGGYKVDDPIPHSIFLDNDIEDKIPYTENGILLWFYNLRCKIDGLFKNYFL